MVLVDSAAWIDYSDGAPSAKCDGLDGLLGRELMPSGDLILAEVLQGCRVDAGWREAPALLVPPGFRRLGGRTVALAAAESYRSLRSRGISVRRTIDLMIAP